LLVVFDAFGDDAEAEAVGDGDDGVDYGVGSAGVTDAIDKAAVDLEALDGELIELAEGRVAGAEVVDGKGDAEPGEQVDLTGGLGEVTHHCGLGDLHAEEMRIDVVCGEGFEDVGGEVWTGDLERRDVDVNAYGWEALLSPASGLCAKLVEDPVAEGDDEAAFFGDCDERGGRDETALGMAKADQGLEGVELAADGVHRLIVKLEAAIAEGLANE